MKLLQTGLERTSRWAGQEMHTERLDDQALMQIAIAQAQAAAMRGETPVGAIIVDPSTGTVLASASNSPIGNQDPTAHAEILALRQAALKLGNYRLTGLTLVVTLEPCAMCAGAISHARIGRVIFGANDPKGGAVEHGPKFFDQATCHWRPQVTSGIMEAECGDLLRNFFRERRKGASPASEDGPDAEA